MTRHPGRVRAAGAEPADGLLPRSVATVIFVPGPRRVLARVSGEVDTADVLGLRERLALALAASRTGLDIDLSAVTFCDSSGLHVLLDLNPQALDSGKSLVLSALSAPVALLLDRSGTRRVLAVGTEPGGGAGPPPPAAAREVPSTPADFAIGTRRSGSTVRLTPSGELDMDAGPALDAVRPALEGADVVVCDMRHLTFLDVTGLALLLAFVRYLTASGIAFLTYNWQGQPRRLLDLLDDRYATADRRRPTLLLRRLQGSASAARAAGAARSRPDPQDSP
ncbi:STAS domain-containing protein [Streptomyces sp. NPDC057411]|uniref:STAS domain-containing protein n=1 Tax=unclassified Streptomyces TaxID=2593676 RepID=UPI003644E9B5